MKNLRLALAAFLVIFSLIFGACYELLEDGADIQGRLVIYPDPREEDSEELDGVAWFKILRRIEDLGQMVTLYIKDCKVPTVVNASQIGLYEDSGEVIFNPYFPTNQGKNLILRIILPDAATVIIQAVAASEIIPPGEGDEDIAEQIEKSAFAYFTNLRSVSALNVKDIGNFAFYGLNNLSGLDFPRAVNIGAYAFSKCTSISSARFHQVKDIDDYAFRGCSALSNTYFPEADIIGIGSFQNCTSLTEVFFEKVTKVKGYAFEGCTSLTRATFDMGVKGSPADIESTAFPSGTQVINAP
jgi:hypothetical protein